MRQLSLKRFSKFFIKNLWKFIVLGVVILYIMFFMHSSLKEDKVVFIEKGSSLNQIATKLKSEDVIYSRILFKVFSYLNGTQSDLKAGEYLFTKNISLYRVNQTLVWGRVFVYPLIIPEGYTNQQIFEIIRNASVLTGDIDETLYREGQLMPNTYYVVRGMTRAGILEQMKSLMDYVLEEEWQSRAPGLPYKNKYEALIMASIVEKETGIESERNLIAGVFVNRLKKGMKLQTDPTVVYAITKGYGSMRGQALYRKDLSVDSKYNTYKYYGLPIGPICNPGAAAINAALHPEDTEYLYFVANGNGGHKFSIDYKSHQDAHQEWREIKKSNGGNSSVIKPLPNN